MAKNSQVPTDSEILSYNNVPTKVAAAYLGLSPDKVRDGLRQKSAPYGHPIYNEEKDSWTFYISPGLLTNYKNGVMPGMDIKGIVEMITSEVENLLEVRSKAAMEILCPGLLAVNKR